MLDYDDGAFDALYTFPMLHHVAHLTKSLGEMIRVVNWTKPNARIVLTQAASNSVVTRLINKHCIPRNTVSSRQPDHQGFLLQTAMDFFKSKGYGDLKVTWVDARLEVDCVVDPDDPDDPWMLHWRASEMISSIYHQSDPNREEMMASLRANVAMEMRQDGTCAIGEYCYWISDDTVALVVRPSKPSD